MNRRLLVLGLAGLLSAGCRNVSSDAREPEADTASAATPVSGTDLDPENLEKVRVGETLRSYPVGRYVDIGDPNVMHEAHVVYRKESGATWNLNPNAPTVVPLGPVLAVSEPARAPDPLPAELEQKMAEQNQLMAALIEQNEALASELAKMNQEIADLRQKAGADKEATK